jgi:hypothetical protein
MSLPFEKNNDDEYKAAVDLAKAKKYNMNIRYKLMCREGNVWLQKSDGHVELQSFHFNFQYRNPDNNTTTTLAHPWYNGILDANEYMKEHFPKIWNLVKFEMIHDKHCLFSGPNWSFDTMMKEEYSTSRSPSLWNSVLVTIISSHTRSATGLMFDRNTVTKSHHWKPDGCDNFIAGVIDEIFDNESTDDFIASQECLYNVTGNNRYSFAELVRGFCDWVEATIDDHFTNDRYLGEHWYDFDRESILDEAKKYNLKIVYKILCHKGDVWIEKANGLDDLLALKGKFQEHDNENETTTTLAHPLYNGILDANDYMKEHFPEVWKTVLFQMIHGRHHLFSGTVQSLETMVKGEPSSTRNPKVWEDVIISIVTSHVHIAVPVMFDRNTVTKSRKWKSEGYKSFVDTVTDDIFENEHTHHKITEEERLYNTTSDNDYTFELMILLYCGMIERHIEDSFSKDEYLGVYWE